MSEPVSNPFCTRHVRPGVIPYQFDEGAFAGPVSDSAQIDRLVAKVIETRRSVIVGPHGSGKSTLLKSLLPVLRARFSDVIEVHLLASQPHYRCVFEASNRLGPGGLLVVDGMEQLAIWERISLLWRPKGRKQTILATAHAPLLGFTTLRTTTLSAPLIRWLTERQIAFLHENTQNAILLELSKRSLGPQTNLRDLWFDLYEIAERMR